MQYEIDYAERTARGAALLDAWNPDWPTLIDLSRLNVGCPWNCVLSQTAGAYEEGQRNEFVLGSYAKGMNTLGIDPEGSSECGFVLLGDDYRLEYDGDSTSPVYARLTEAWRTLITDRLAVRS